MPARQHARRLLPGERCRAAGVAHPLNGIALGVAAAVLISVTNVFSRLHFEAGSNPVTFLLARYALFAVALGLGLAVLGRLERVAPGRRVDLAIAGVLNVAGATCLAFAIERIEVSLAVVVLYLFPFLTLAFSSALRRERPSLVVLAALALAFGGLVLALDVGGSPPATAGVAFALGAAVSIAASFTWIEHRLGEVGDATRLLGIVVVGLVCTIVLAAVRGGVVWPLPSPHGWTTLLVATASFGAASAAMFMAVPRIGATATALLMNLEPPATVLLAVWLLGDRLAASQLLGIAIVLGAVVAAQLLARRRGATGA